MKVDFIGGGNHPPPLPFYPPTVGLGWGTPIKEGNFSETVIVSAMGFKIPLRWRGGAERRGGHPCRFIIYSTEHVINAWFYVLNASRRIQKRVDYII